MYNPVSSNLSNHIGTSAPGWIDHATPAQQLIITPLTMSEAASDAITFAAESSSKRRLRSVTTMTGMLDANVARDTSTGHRYDKE